MAIAAATLLLAIGGAANTIRQGKLQEKAAKKAEAIDLQNAERAEVVAQDKAARIRRRGLLVLGEQRAQQAAGGGSVTSGSFLDIQQETTRAVETDALNAIFGGETERFNFQGRAARSRFEGVQAKQRSFASAGGQILGGVRQASKDGLFGKPAPVTPKVG